MQTLLERLVHHSPDVAPAMEFSGEPVELSEMLDMHGNLQEILSQHVDEDAGATAACFQERLSIGVAGNLTMQVSNIVFKQLLFSSDTALGDIHELDEMPSDAVKLQRFDMTYLTMLLRAYAPTYNKQRFEAIMLRNANFRAALLIFATRRMLCTGCCNVAQALRLLAFGVDRLNENDQCPPKHLLPPPQVCNIVLSGRFPNNICLHVMLDRYADCCAIAHNPPGVSISLWERSSRSIFVFSTGNVTHSGISYPQEIYEDMCKVYRMLCECQDTAENLKLERKLALKSFEREWSACVVRR